MPDILTPLHAIEAIQANWVVTLPSIFSGIALAYPVVQWWYGRKDKAADNIMTREQRLMADADARILQASKIDADVITRLQAELVRVTGRILVVEGERDAMETDLNAHKERERYWHRRAHDMRHIATVMTTLVTDAARAAGREMPATPDLSLPAFNIDPLPT